MLLVSPVRGSVAALCPVPTCVAGGLLVPKNTSYANASPSGSEQLQLNVGEVGTPVAPFVGFGFDGTAGGLFGGAFVVNTQIGLDVVFPLGSFAIIFQ